MDWRTLEVDDIKLIDNFTNRNIQSGDLSGVNLYIWRNLKKLEISLNRNFLVIRGMEDSTRFFYPPLSDSQDTIRRVSLSLLEDGYLLRGVPEEMYDIFNKVTQLVEERDHFDYIYKVEELIELKGRRFHKKKNHLNKFLKTYNFRYEKLNSENIEEVSDFLSEWYNNREYPNKKLAEELVGVIDLLHTEVFSLVRGGIIRVDNKVSAFTLGEAITDNTILIHVEKGFPHIEGIYQAINKFFLEAEFGEYEFVNREEDLGIESLRKAKESYHPVKLLKKYRSVLNS